MRKVLGAVVLLVLGALSFAAGSHFRHRTATTSAVPVPALGNSPGALAANVRLATAEATSGSYQLTLSGRVAADESRVFRLSAGADGYVLKTLDGATGAHVTKDELLATVNTPELRTAVQAYVQFAARGNDAAQARPSDWRSQTIPVAASRLRALGMTETQMKNLAAGRDTSDGIQVLSPSDGYIVARGISSGQLYSKGAEFYRIADLSHVWIFADVHQTEARYIRPGAVATISLPGSSKSVQARIAAVLPQVDPATRTMRLRLDAENPGIILRPEMFVTVTLPVQATASVSVPSEALLDSGLNKRLFVAKSDGSFESRDVEVGWTFSGRSEILKGLASGERVVVPGTFLLDSETRLKTDDAVRPPAKDASPMQPQKPQPEHKHEAMAAMPMASSSEALHSASKDPVCGMDVDPEQSMAEANTAQYRGATYHFCSSECKEKFEKNPEHYAASGHDEHRH